MNSPRSDIGTRRAWQDWPMTDDTITLRQPTADEIRAWVQPTSEAFAYVFTDAELEQEQRLWELDRLIGALDGETWVGTGGAYTFGLTVPGGREVGAAGIAMIGVTPSHRRRGILRLMMRWLLDQARERNEPVAVLWASESAIYQHFGFGIGTLQSTFDIERGRVAFVRPAPALGRIRLVDLDEAARLFPAIYDAVRVRTAGALTRNDAKWRHDYLDDHEWQRAANGMKYRAVLEVEGEARGYAIYRTKAEWTDMGPNNTLSVIEVVGLDPAAERAVWEWLAGIDLVGHIKGRGGPVPHPLMLQLTEPRRLGLAVREGMWLRLIDMRAALEARSYGAAGSLTFEVTDEFCPWNSGRWRLDVVGDGCGTLTASDADPDLTLDTADLATVYLGTFTFADLARAGRVGQCRPGAIAEADGLFATAGAPWSSTMF
jgi:predicted acetyltransferase